MANILVKQQFHIVPVTFETVQAEHWQPGVVHVDNIAVGSKTKLPVNTENELAGHALISMAADSQVSINLVRRDIDVTAPLFITVSNEELLEVLKPEADDLPLPPEVQNTLQIKASEMTSDKVETVFLEVRFGANDGPVISKLGVCVMPKLNVNLQAYIVHISSKQQLGAAPVNAGFPYKSVIEQLQAFWLQYGIVIELAKPRELNVELANNQVMDISEINHLLDAHHAPNHINLYFVPHISGITEQVLALPPAEYKDYSTDGKMPVKHPGIFMATQGNANSTKGAHTLTQKLAIFLGLNPLALTSEAKDSGLLAANLMSSIEPSPTLPFLTLKPVTYHSIQGEAIEIASQCFAARAFINKGPKAVYG